MKNIREMLREVRILPVITPVSTASALAAVGALHEGGLRAFEITLRSSSALEAIEAVRAERPQALLGAGTILSAASLERAAQAGADFGVSPGLTPELLQAARSGRFPLLPGINTPSEVIHGMEFGMDCFKLFPAAPIDGLALLKSFHPPFPDVMFCPTGGIGQHNMSDYLAMPNVLCVGGSWMLPEDEVAAGRWARITEIARQSLAACAVKKHDKF